MPAVLRGGWLFAFFRSMTIRYRVQQWLGEGGSFRDGVTLLEMAGALAATRRHAPSLSQAFISAREKEALRVDMVRLLGQLPEDETPAPAPAPGTPSPQKIPDTPRIAALRNKAILLLKARSDLKGRLLVRGLDDVEKYSDADRFEIAREIMLENVPALDEIYSQIRRFEDDGIEPADDAAMIRAQAVAEMKQVNSLRSKISRIEKAKKGGEKIDEDELNSLIQRKDELEEGLGL